MPRRSDKRNRRTLLKFRVTPLVRMPKSMLFRKLREACRHGIVPDDIRISTLEWGHEQGDVYQPGTVLPANKAEELRNCYSLLVGVEKNDVRFERPDA